MFQVPLDAVSVRPTATVPLITGSPVFAGTAGLSAAEAAAALEPPALLAVTCTSKASPASVVPTV